MTLVRTRIQIVPQLFFVTLLFGVRLLCVPHIAEAQAVSSPERLWYIPNTTAAVESLRAHADAIDIVAPQIYAAASSGKLLGVPNPEVLTLARVHGVRVMPLVVNQSFSQSGVHSFLQNPVAQLRLIAALISEAKAQGYVGYQYDFEHMQVSDKDLYSAFVAMSATYFHGAQLQFSVAVAPKHSDNPATYGNGSWQNWTGAFDYAAIGRSTDFISVMAYDDSTSIASPAPLSWVQSVITYTLARVPASKVSLGIPLYAWVRRDVGGKLDHIVAYPAIARLITSGIYITKGWNAQQGNSWVVYTKGGRILTAWYEDQASFQEKMKLVSANNFIGFSAWALGQEDPEIWQSLLPRGSRATNESTQNYYQ